MLQISHETYVNEDWWVRLVAWLGFYETLYARMSQLTLLTYHKF